jgi:hypothetical protein
MGMTRQLSWMMAGCLCLAPLPVQAQPAVRALLEQAITAHGGEKSLTTLKAGYLQSQGTAYVPGPVQVTHLTVYQLPDRLKQIQEIDGQGQKVRIVTGFAHEKAWMTVNGQNREVDKKMLTEIGEALHLLRVNRLVALREKSYRLAALPEIKVTNRPAQGLRVSRDGHRDVDLYFDRDTHLLVMLAHRVPDPRSGKEVTEVRLYSDYHSVNGVQEPRKVVMWRDGQKFLEGEVTEAQILEKVDTNIFENPQ